MIPTILIVAVVLAIYFLSVGSQGKGSYTLSVAAITIIKREFGDLARQYETKFYPAAFLLGIIGRESQGVRSARGNSGEVGIFQIMPFHFPKSMSDKERIKDKTQFEIATGSVLSPYAIRLINAERFTERNLAAMYNGGPGGYRKTKPQSYGRDVERLTKVFD